jgi:hypothetical protein
MDEFWIGFWAGIIAWVVFWWAVKKILVAIVLHIAKDQIAEFKRSGEEILLKLVKYDDMLYCYRKDNEEFICQAKTLQEVTDIFKQRFPNNTARILQEDADGVIL